MNQHTLCTLYIFEKKDIFVLWFWHPFFSTVNNLFFWGGFFYNLQPFNTFVHFQCVDCEAEAEVEAEVQDIPSSVNRLVAPQTGAKLS